MTLRSTLVCATAAALLLTVASGALPYDREVLSVPMRDGVKLSANLFRPKGDARTSVLLVRTPYGKGTALIKGYQLFVDQGFAVVVQDVRGRYESGGNFRPPTQEIADGEDTLNWIAQQPWCDGNIGMLGGSYLGIAQWKAALTGNRHLKAIFPVVAGIDDYDDRFYSRGGALKLGHRLLWIAENLRLPAHPRVDFATYTSHRPLRTADKVASGRQVDFWQGAVNHPTADDYWRSISVREQIDRVRVPAFIISGWYDNFAQSDLEAFTLLQKRSKSNHVVIGPWAHDMSMPFPGVDFGPDANIAVRRTQLAWFDHWLRRPRPLPAFHLAPVRVFVMGANRWRNEEEWPPRRTKYIPFYLSSTKGANSSSGDGELAMHPPKPGVDQFTYDPMKPVPTRGGAVCCNTRIFPWGPIDQRDVESRADVLVYTTRPLKTDLETTGPVRATLFVSTTATDTDFTAKLVDVFPDGQARNLTDGILRLRYRTGRGSAVLAKPGEIYAITVDAGVTSNLFKAGHRIRVEISSSNFPRFDRNPNTGRPIADEANVRLARQTVYHGGRTSSHVLLPVMH